MRVLTAHLECSGLAALPQNNNIRATVSRQVDAIAMRHGTSHKDAATHVIQADDSLGGSRRANHNTPALQSKAEAGSLSGVKAGRLIIQRQINRRVGLLLRHFKFSRLAHLNVLVVIVITPIHLTQGVLPHRQAEACVERTALNAVSQFAATDLLIKLTVAVINKVAPGTPSGFVLQVLHHWQLRYQIDGFHLVGDASLAEEASKDALLRKTKLIFLGFDGARIYQGKRPWFRNLGEHNQGYQYHIRRFLKGDEGSLSDFTYYLRRSPETHGVINYLADHDGFTLYDSVSYEQKHNLDNGEDNMDGSNENLTWNCGAEGVTRKPAVRALRLRQLKNAVLMLMTSQGTPLIYGGDEFGNSQKGNNNAWCQDNKTGWIDWKAAARNPEFAAFVKAAIAFRKAHPALHGEREPRLIDYKSYGCPDMSFHSQRAWFSQMENTCRFIGVMYCGSYFQDKDGNKDDDLYIAYNMHWNPHELALPSLPEQKVWYLTADTNTPEVFLTEENQKKVSAKTVIVPPRSIIILTGKQEKRQNDESMAAL